MANTKISAATKITSMTMADAFPVARPGNTTAYYGVMGQIAGLAGVMSLSTASVVGATSISLNSVPTWAATYGGYIVIDVGTIECEVRQPTLSGTTASFTTGLTYAHAANDVVLWIPDAVLSAKWFGAKGDGTTDDTTPLQRLIDGSFEGATCYFPGPGPYMTDQLVYRASRRYVGDAFGGYGTVVKFKNSATGTGVFVSYNWYNDSDQSDNSTTFADLTIDGNRDNNTTGTGVLTLGQRHYFQRVLFQNLDGDGIKFTETTRNATTLAENAVSSHIESCRFLNITGYGLYVDDGSRFTDGYLTDNAINGCDADGAYIGAGSGWKVHGCHFSSIKGNAIRVKNGGYSDVSHNYIEGYGSSGTVGTYHGIWVHAPNEAIISANRIKNANTTAGNTFHGIFVQGSSLDDLYFNLSNNVIYGNGTETAIRLEKSGATTIYGDVVGNRAFNNVPLEQYSFTVTNVTHTGNSYQFAAAVPGAGWWPQGMRIYNNDMDARENEGWVCITSGTSGTWRAFGEARDVNGWPGDHCRVHRVADQTIGTGSWTAIAFTDELYDNATLHSNVTNNSRITFARGGPAVVGATVRFEPNSTGTRGVRILLNGTTAIAEEYGDAPATGTTTWRQTCTTGYNFAAGDYIECEVYQASGGNLDLQYIDGYSPFFWASQFSLVGP